MMRIQEPVIDDYGLALAGRVRKRRFQLAQGRTTWPPRMGPTQDFCFAPGKAAARNNLFAPTAGISCSTRLAAQARFVLSAWARDGQSSSALW
jgi:hypothetical protein